ncbi:MAG: nucleoside-diphosphate kinase [Dysgonomonas sp.]
MEKTLVILKPSAVQREFVGEVISRFEKKGLKLSGVKMMQLDDKILDEHYEHLKEKPFFQRVKNSMMSAPVIVLCLEGLDATCVVRNLIGITNGRDAAPGTIRGDFSVSAQENIVHASDSAESAKIELKRFFSDSEIFEYNKIAEPYLYDLMDPKVSKI